MEEKNLEMMLTAIMTKLNGIETKVDTLALHVLKGVKVTLMHQMEESKPVDMNASSRIPIIGAKR